MSPLIFVIFVLFASAYGREECLGADDPLGLKYDGTKTTTASGRTCQVWATDNPHEHENTQERFDRAGGFDMYAIENFCRNVGGQTYGPWCYTTDPNLRWEKCDVPKCPKECVEEDDPQGLKYEGTESKTESGIPCQVWASDNPHDHENTQERFDRAGGFDMYAIRNYCRNVGGQTYGPWCYTTDPKVRWQKCNIPKCPKECIEADDPQGLKYEGTESKTESGIPCQVWATDNPHDHENTQERFDRAGGFDMYAIANYCRNVGGQTYGPWCYTTDPDTRWQKCNIPTCTATADDSQDDDEQDDSQDDDQQDKQSDDVSGIPYQVCYRYNKDCIIHGMDLIYVDNSNLQDCELACLYEPQCLSFQFNHLNACILKKYACKANELTSWPVNVDGFLLAKNLDCMDYLAGDTPVPKGPRDAGFVSSSSGADQLSKMHRGTLLRARNLEFADEQL